jgi:hypothetical protein
MPQSKVSDARDLHPESRVSATGEFRIEKMLPGKGQNIGEKGLRSSTGATHGAPSPLIRDGLILSGTQARMTHRAVEYIYEAEGLMDRSPSAVARGAGCRPSSRAIPGRLRRARRPPYSTPWEKRVTRNSSRQMPRWLTGTETVINHFLPEPSNQEKLLSCGLENVCRPTRGRIGRRCFSGGNAGGIPLKLASPSPCVEIIIRAVSAFRFGVAMRRITTFSRGLATVRVCSLNGRYGGEYAFACVRHCI